MNSIVRVIVSASIGLVLALTIAGCGSAPPLALIATDSGSQQHLAVGQKLTISLPFNAIEDTRWAVDGQVPPQLEQSGPPQVTSGAATPDFTRTEVWTFVGKSTGTGTLVLKLWDPRRASVAPGQTFEVTVDVL